MTPVGFEPTISTGERPQTYALDRTGRITILYILSLSFLCVCLDFLVGDGEVIPCLLTELSCLFALHFLLLIMFLHRLIKNVDC